DLFVVPLVQGRRPADWEEAGRMLLAVEVLSPGTARRDRILKREWRPEGAVEPLVIVLAEYFADVLGEKRH
ncbi:MAG TPA: hypothetical protein VF761_04300, partial [Gemmatimonadaceae bacterium]